MLVKGNRGLVAIEIKYTISPKLSKGFAIATEDLETPHNFIITPGEAQFPLTETITVCGFEAWIAQRLPELIERLFS